MRFIGAFLKQLLGILSIRKLRKAKALGQTEEGKRSIKYGVISLVLAFMSLAIVYGCVYGGIVVFKIAVTTNLAIIGNILAIAGALALFLLPVNFAISSVSYAIYQIYVNKKRYFGWITLIISLLAVLGTIALFIFIGLKMVNG